MADFFTYLILGVLQGVFEWIPISSEGVVALAANYLKAGVSPVDFALFLHVGTLAAALVYYRQDWLNVILLKDWRLIRFLVIAALISLPLGFAVYQIVGQAAVGTGLLALTGIGLLFTAFFQQKKTSLNLGPAKLALLSGVLQGLAVIPGFSRSGATIFGLSLGDLKPKEILRLSYLMSVPAVAASAGYLLIFKTRSAPLDAWPAIAASFLVGLLFLKALASVSGKINFAKFALAFAILCFAGVALEFMLS